MTFVEREEALLLDRLGSNVHRSFESAVCSRLSSRLDCILFRIKLNISYRTSAAIGSSSSPS